MTTKIEVLEQLIGDIPSLMTNQEANIREYLKEELKKEKDRQRFLREDRVLFTDSEDNEIILRSLLPSWEKTKKSKNQNLY